MSYARLPTDHSIAQDELKESLLSDDLESTDSFSPEIPQATSSGLARNWLSLIANWTLYATLIAVLAAIVNLSLLSKEVYKTRLSSPLPTRRPSTYIGFDQVLRNASSPQWPLQRRGFPEYFGVLDLQSPNTQSPNSQNVLIDSSHTLITQFFVHDYGLEHCASASFFPGKDRLGTKSYVREGQTSALEVWLLEDPKEKWSFFNPKAYSWSTKPSRKLLLGSLNSDLMNDTTPTFSCSSGSTIIVEFGCGNPDCRLEFVQERPGAKLGFWLIQSEAEIVSL